MAEFESRDWGWVAGIAATAFTIWKYVIGGGKQRISTENKKTDYEAEGQRIENIIKSEEFNKREAAERAQIIESLTEKLRASEKRESDLQRQVEDWKRKFTIVNMRYDALKNK